MATHNVSKLGNDSTGDGSQLAPWRTIDKAIDEAFTAGGVETIVILDGVDNAWVGTDLDAANQYLILGANPPDSLTVRPESGATIELIPGVATALFRQTSGTGLAGTAVTLEDLVLGRDVTSKGGEDSNYLFWCRDNADVAGTHTVTFTRCTFRNPVFAVIWTPHDVDLTVTDCILEDDRVGSRGLLAATNWDGGSCTINGLLSSQTAHTVSGFGCISIDYAGAGIPTRITGVTATVSSAAADEGGGTMYGVVVRNSDDIVLRDIDVTLVDASQGATWAGYGVSVYGNDAALSTAAPLIENITTRMRTSGGFAVSFGGDLSDVAANEADGGRMRNITVIGSGTFIAANGHGVGFGEHDDCTAYGLDVSYCDIGLLDKVGDANTYAGAVVHKCGGGATNAACYAKGATNSNFFNITVLIEPGYECKAFLAGVDGATNTTGAEFKYSCVVATGATAQKVIDVQASQTATFDYNHYFIGGALPANPFSYQATNYAGAAEWIAARETNGAVLSSNPLEADFSPVAGSDIETGGVRWFTTHPIGADGEPFPAYDISIGGMQSRHVAGHPSQI